MGDKKAKKEKLTPEFQSSSIEVKSGKLKQAIESAKERLSGEQQTQKDDNTKNEKKNKIIDYRSDKSLTHISDDQFKHSHYVEVLTDILEKCETPINVGLYGKWGVGKSSIVHMLKEKIEDGVLSKEFTYVEVDAWSLSGESLQQGILEEINHQLGDVKNQQEIEDDLYNIKEVESTNFNKTFIKFAVIWAIIATIAGFVLYFENPENLLTILSSIGVFSIIAALIPLTKLFLGSSKRIIPKAASSLQFKKIYKELVESQKNKKLVIVIDNLDRCDDKIAVGLLGIIQTFMVKPNCINILACDDEAIIRHLRGVKGKDYTDKDGNEFLSKFFQVTIRIPPFIGENLEKYAEELMKSRSVSFSNFVKPILISGAIENPRKINQFLNNAVALYRLASLKEHDDKLPKGVITEHTDFLIKIIVIRHEWPYFYKELEKNPELINDSVALKEWFKKQEKGILLQIEGLQKFLNKTSFAYVDDITPFLRLNQESYAAESGIDEFTEAIISNDVNTAVELFSKLEVEKQNQYLKKIEELTNKYEDKNDNPSLLICTYSIIGILEKIIDATLKQLTIAILGKHLSSSLLGDLEKYDLEKHNLFPYFEEMIHHFSTPIYDKLIGLIIKDDTINKKLVNQFLKNGNIISEETMDKLDSTLADYSETNEDLVLTYTEELCQNFDWPSLNITKPSYLLITIIDNINFDSSEPDNKRIATYSSIQDKIDVKERERFVRHLQNKIKESVTSSQAIPAGLLSIFDEIPILEYEQMDDSLKNLFVTLNDSIKNNPDPEQKKTILELLIKFESKLSKNSEGFEGEYFEKLQESIANFLESGNHDTLIWFNELIKNTEKNYLGSNEILEAYWNNFENNGPNNADILKFLLTNTTSDTRTLLTNKLRALIETKDEGKYSTLLNVVSEKPSDFSDEIVSSVIESCKQVTRELDYPEHVNMDQIIIKLHSDLYPYQIQDIIDRAIELISNEEQPLQDNGLNLLKQINEKTGSVANLVGIDKSIEISNSLIDNNDENVRRYLNFVFNFVKRFTWSQRDLVIDISKKLLDTGQPVNMHNLALDFIPKLQDDDRKKVFGEIFKLVESTSDENIKNRCKQILISSKDHLNYTDRKQMQKLFGEKVLD